MLRYAHNRLSLPRLIFILVGVIFVGRLFFTPTASHQESTASFDAARQFLRQSGGKVLVLYAYQEADQVKRENLDYFLEHGLSEHFDCIVVCNGPCTVTKPGIQVIIRENVGLDFGAWRAGLQSRTFSVF